MARIFGHIPGVEVGAVFANRKAVAGALVHKPFVAGISGSESQGADSIVLSGGYEDDRDYGESILYTGHGGRDPTSGRQIADQEFAGGNRALARNIGLGLPVRVVRGPDPASNFAPPAGYRYDGLYRVSDAWRETGKSGFIVWRFRLDVLDSAPLPSSSKRRGHEPPPRVPQTVQRIVRDTKLSRQVKAIHSYTCQICGIRLEGPAGPYAEAAHIRPLGEPHNGPDIIENILCLCPNHHVLFDLGAVTIADDLVVDDASSRLRMVPEHEIDVAFLRYHREHYGVH